jgi:hypothetical protein
MNVPYLVFSLICLGLLPFSIILLYGMIRKKGVKFNTPFISIEESSGDGSFCFYSPSFLMQINLMNNVITNS